MKQIKISIIFSLFFSVQFAIASDDVNRGKQLFEQNCAACHGVVGGMDMSKRLAPPIMAVKMHYTKHYADKDAFTKAVVAWVENPQKSNSRMKGAIKKFNLMPKVAVSAEDVEMIAAYIFEGELDSPEGFDAHFKKMHGGKKGGCGKGKGKHEHKHKHGEDS